MRYWFLNIEIIQGEYTNNSISVQTTQKEDFDAEAYCAEFYACAEGKDEGSDYYSFDCGNIACRVYDIKEVKKADYDVLKKFIY